MYKAMNKNIKASSKPDSHLQLYFMIRKLRIDLIGAS